jgi:hypothetical protein
MVKTKDLVNVRPQLPSFTHISEDISGADDDDVIFSDNKIGTQDPTSDVQGLVESGAAVTSKLASQAAAAAGNSTGVIGAETSMVSSDGIILPSVDAVYRQALEFISSTQQLKAELSSEKETRARLHDAVALMQSSLESMRLKVDDLRANTTRVGSGDTT